MRAPDVYYEGKRIRCHCPDSEWLRHHYLDLNKSTAEIGREVGVTHATIARWLRDVGISKPKEQLAKNHSKRMSGEGNPAWEGGSARRYQIRLLEQSGKPKRCAWCGASGLDGGPQGTMGLQIHHLDHDPMNGDLDNLEWLCGPCNRLESHIKALEDAGRAISIMFEGALHVYFTEHNQ